MDKKIKVIIADDIQKIAEMNKEIAMRNDNIDSKRLFSEIDSLDDEVDSSLNNYNHHKISGLLVIILIIVLIALSLLYFGDTNQQDFFEEKNEEYSQQQIENYLKQEDIARDSFKVQKDNIQISNSYLNYNKELIAIISNDNDETITDLKVEVIFYDEENKPIEIDANDISILENNSKCYVKFVETPENFERYEFLISKDYYWYDNLEYVTEQISYEINENEDYLDLVVHNNYSKDISEASFQILFYDEMDNVMDVENIYLTEIEKNETQEQEVNLFLWDNNTYDEVKFNRYEINFLGAYIY